MNTELKFFLEWIATQPWYVVDPERRYPHQRFTIRNTVLHAALFDTVEDHAQNNALRVARLTAHCMNHMPAVLDQLRQCREAFHRHGWDTGQLDGVLTAVLNPSNDTEH